ncbi:MAG TPA: tetratricopeptide repeat protein [Acidimicrobiales bacterium]|nr:tetratricopeptide repeat protein [Acidimicrobiales bacterium]
MPVLPEGTVTFLFTDVEGSTAAWERDPDATGALIRQLDALVAQAVDAAGGTVVKARGEGDSHFCVFAGAADAAAAGLALLEALDDFPLPVRMAIHTGEADLRDGDYFGRTVNRAARLRSAAHGGQLLLSSVTADLVREALPSGASLRDLGVHRLKDLSSPESIWQLVHPSVAPTTKPLRTLDVLRNNLPLQLTDLIGRDLEVAEVLGLMSSSRLVTLVGLGGSGKTRLALQAAAEASASHPGGVWLTELAPLNTAPEVAPAILAAVGGPPAADALAEIVDWIGDRKVLLLLDNCEHVIDACAFAVEHLLSRCAHLHVLATSRQPLEVRGETVFRIPPLGLCGSPGDDLAQLAASPSVRLFTERGRQVSPGFELTPTNAEAVAALCEGLDGMPLAIELAAARLKVLDPAQILARLGDRLALVDGARSADGGRTVRAAIEWSYDLLKPKERDLLRRIAIFEASASLEAVEAVCAESPGDPADALANLVDHSLVVVDTSETGRRYRLLDLVRAYALERLDEAGEREAMEQARVRWMDESIATYSWSLAREARAEFRGGRADFIAALEWTELHEPQAFSRRVLVATQVWAHFDWLDLADRWAQRALAGAELDPSLRDGLLQVAGNCTFAIGDYERALQYSIEQLSIAEASHDAISAEAAKNSVAAAAMYLSKFDVARVYYEGALESALARPDGRGAAVLYAQNLGLLHSLSGDRNGAVRWFERCAELGQEAGTGAMGLWRLGEQAQARGDLGEAATLLDKALSVALLEGDSWNEIHVYSALGHLAEAEGRWDDAADRYRSAVELSEALGHLSTSVYALLALSRVAVAAGDETKAREYMARGLLQLAGEPAQQVAILASELRQAQRVNQPGVARDFGRTLLSVAQRDASATDVALAQTLLAQCEEALGNFEEARALAIRARPTLAALGKAQILRWRTADLLARCDAILGSSRAEV